MASRRVSISALLCEDDPPATSPPRVPTYSPDSVRHRPTEHHLDRYREAYPPHPPQPAPPRLTPSPDLPHTSLHTWPPPSTSRRAYNPPQGMFPTVQTAQYDPASLPLRTSHSHQPQQPPYLPPSSPRPSYPQSPFSVTGPSSDSPVSTISLTRTPSIHSPSSPLLYTQRPAPSSGGYYNSPPPSGISQYDPLPQAAVSPTLRHARHHNQTEHLPSSSVRQHSSLSRISTTTTSSFPQALLNPVSPKQSPLGGLEALVQAATVERDRLEARASLDRNADSSRSTVRRSPELLFRPLHEGPRTHIQAPAPRTPITPTLVSGPLLRDSYSESSLRIGPGPETHPSKRQRQSHPHTGSDHSWESTSSWDSSPQFSGLMGPGIKPRGQSSDVRTEIRPTLPLPSRDKEGASAAASRVSPTRGRSARKQHAAEEETCRTHVPGFRGPVTSAPEDSRHGLSAEEPRSMGHQDLRSNLGSHPTISKVSRSDLTLERQTTPPSPPPPPPPQALFTPSGPPVPLGSEPPPRGREDRLSLLMHPPSRSDILSTTTAAAQMFVQTERAPSSEGSKDFTVPMVPVPKEPSIPQVESVPPDNLTSAVQNSPVILASPPTSNVHDVDNAKPVKSPSPPPPFLDEHEADTTLAIQDVRLFPTISRVGLPPPEDVLNSQSSEQEICPPPTTASPSPRALSPTVSDFQDGIHANQPVGDRVSPVPGAGTDALVAESQNPVETSLTPIGEPEAADSPVAVPPVAEAIPHAVSDSPSRTDPSFIPIINEIKSEPTQELDAAMDSKHGQVAEQNHAEMDVDEELLSLIADDLPSRSSHIVVRKHGSPSPEDKPPPSHHGPVKQESAHGILTPLCPSPSPSSSTVNPERVSKPPPDIAVSVHDSETSTLKLEERPTQKKKAKQHAQPKSRVKSSGSAKAKLKVPSDGPSTAPLKSKKSSTAATKRSTVAARSRSTSVMPVSTTPAPGALPSASAPIEAEPDGAEEGTEDKLYCVCKTKYDDERIMIACDRCDEWYHTSCVNMPDLEVDLVDQFICPICVEKNPHLDLRTTWKRRCLNGLKQHDPNSPDACHKPARGAFSKYCSDECGVQYMHMRISLWVESGGNRDRLWETVKSAERREGVVVSARVADGRLPRTTGDQPAPAIIPPKVNKADRELARLRARLETLVQKREALKAEMDVIAWREKVTELAIQHAESIEQCGWDQRLCFGDEEVVEFGASVLESYEETQTDADGTQEEAEWWCMGKKKCDRHSGWQKLRVADVEFDKDTKDQALQKLTKLEREIRKRVEDIVDPHAHLDKAKMLEPSSPRVPVLPRPTVNGQPKHKPNGDQTKKGKKRKE